MAPAHLSHKLALACYVAIFSTYYVIIRMSQSASGQYELHPAIIVVLAECVKLIISASLFRIEHPNVSRGALLHTFKSRDYLMIAPALMYALYNNLTFNNLKAFDANVFQLLMNVRIAITGALSYVILSRRLTMKQCLALFLLLVGCSVASAKGSVTMPSLAMVAMVFVQATLSSLSSVYIEKLLKVEVAGALDSLNFQNATLYAMSIVLNMIVFVASGGTWADVQQLRHITPLMMFVLLLTATGGLVASLVLKHFSAIAKAFATACEMLLTAILSNMLTGTVLTLGFYVSFVMISASIVMYNYAPHPAAAAPAVYELLPREPDTPPPDVEVVVDGEEKVEELHHRRQSSV